MAVLVPPLQGLGAPYGTTTQGGASLCPGLTWGWPFRPEEAGTANCSTFLQFNASLPDRGQRAPAAGPFQQSPPARGETILCLPFQFAPSSTCRGSALLACNVIPGGCITTEDRDALRVSSPQALMPRIAWCFFTTPASAGSFRNSRRQRECCCSTM